MATKVKTVTSMVVSDNEGDNTFQYEPNKCYRGSAMMDDEGNFAFRPFRAEGANARHLRVVRSGLLNGDPKYRWDILRSPHSAKISLTVQNQEELSNMTLLDVMDCMFYFASDQLLSSLDR